MMPEQRTVRGMLVSQVAAGRGMSEAAVRELARGRVWTGKDALARGLVDCLGGLQDAIQLAKQEAGLPLEVLQPDPNRTTPWPVNNALAACMPVQM